MPRGLCGKILSLDLGFSIPSSRTMGFSLIAKLLGGIVVNSVLRIGIQLRLIPRGMDRPRLSMVIVNEMKKRLDDAKGK